jgi:4-amino-4-deoxy-L-arabinose transferase-like glycosyltransferase
LSGGDGLANMIQWFSFIGSIIGISLIARELGADRPGQLFSAAFCATIPMAILQASNTENHLSTAFWLVCFVYFSLHAFHHSSPMDIIAIGLSLIQIHCLFLCRTFRDSHHTVGLLFQ